MRSIVVGNIKPVPLVTAGDGLTLISNTDANNTIYLGDDAGVTVADQYNNVGLSPGSFLVVDGMHDVWAICPTGQTVSVDLIVGGQSFFLLKLITSIVVSSLSQGLFGPDYIFNSAGLFIYSGTPAHGNLIASIAPTSGTDTKLNPYIAGLATYANDGFGTQSVLNSSGLFFENSTFTPGNGAASATFSSAGVFQVGIVSVGGGGTIQFLQAGGVQSSSGTPSSPTLFTTDTWHSLSVSIWAGTIKYTLNAIGNVHIVTNTNLTTPASAVNGTAIATLPAAYRPTSNRFFNGSHTGTTNFQETWELTTGGGLIPTGFGTSSPVVMNDQVPLGV